MTAEKKDGDAVTRLTKLASQLEQAYPKAGDRVAAAIKPVDAAIKAIGVAYSSQRAFHSEKHGDGSLSHYRLCADRAPNNGYKLLVAIATASPVWDKQKAQWVVKDGDGDVKLHWTRDLCDPKDLPLHIRARILDALDQFAEEYQEHVRKERGGLLNGSSSKEAKQAAVSWK